VYFKETAFKGLGGLSDRKAAEIPNRDSPIPRECRESVWANDGETSKKRNKNTPALIHTKIKKTVQVVFPFSAQNDKKRFLNKI
jgi:hypothetical protein